MPSPPPGSPSAAAADGDECIERPWPPRMKMKLAPYAMYRVFGGMGPNGNIAAGAYVGLHFGLYFVRFLSLSPVPERALYWGSVHAVVQPLCFTATVLILCAFVRWYMALDGVYVEEYVPPPHLLQRPTAAVAAATVVEQLPPPPPQMDMCCSSPRSRIQGFALLDQEGFKVLLSSIKARIQGVALSDKGFEMLLSSIKARIQGAALLDQGKDSRCWVEDCYLVPGSSPLGCNASEDSQLKRVQDEDAKPSLEHID